VIIHVGESRPEDAKGVERHVEHIHGPNDRIQKPMITKITLEIDSGLDDLARGTMLGLQQMSQTTLNKKILVRVETTILIHLISKQTMEIEESKHTVVTIQTKRRRDDGRVHHNLNITLIRESIDLTMPRKRDHIVEPDNLRTITPLTIRRDYLTNVVVNVDEINTLRQHVRVGTLNIIVTTVHEVGVRLVVNEIDIVDNLQNIEKTAAIMVGHTRSHRPHYRSKDEIRLGFVSVQFDRIEYNL
jgi:hypothetical protein